MREGISFPEATRVTYGSVRPKTSEPIAGLCRGAYEILIFKADSALYLRDFVFGGTHGVCLLHVPSYRRDRDNIL